MSELNIVSIYTNMQLGGEAKPENKYIECWGAGYNKVLEKKYKDLMPFKQSLKLCWQARHPTQALQEFDKKESTHNLTRVLLPSELFTTLFEGNPNEHLAFIETLEMVYNTDTGVRLINYVREKGERWQIFKTDNASVCDIKNNRLYLRSNEALQHNQQHNNQYSIVDEYIHEIVHCCTKLPDKDGDHPSGPTNELTLRIQVEAGEWNNLRIEYDGIEDCHDSLYGMFKPCPPFRSDANSAKEDAWKFFGYAAYSSFTSLFTPGDSRLADCLSKTKEPSLQQYNEIKQLIVEAMAQNSLQESDAPLLILNEKAQQALENFNKNQKLSQAHIETKAVIRGEYQERLSRESEDQQLLRQSTANNAADWAERKAILSGYYRGMEAEKAQMKQRDEVAKLASASKASESGWSVAAVVAGASMAVEAMDSIVERATAKKTNIVSLTARGELRRQASAEKAQQKELEKECKLIDQKIAQLNENLKILDEAYEMTQAFLDKCASAVTPRSLVEAIDRKNRLSNSINRQSRLLKGQIEKIEILDNALLTKITAYTLSISNEELKKYNMNKLGVKGYKEKLESIKQASIKEKRIAAANSSLSANQLADHEMDRILNPVAGSSKESEYVKLPNVPEHIPEVLPVNSPPKKKRKPLATPLAESIKVARDQNQRPGEKLAATENGSEMMQYDQPLNLDDLEFDTDNLLQTQEQSMELSDIIDNFTIQSSDILNSMDDIEQLDNIILPAGNVFSAEDKTPLISVYRNANFLENTKSEFLAINTFNLVRERFKKQGVKSENKVRFNDINSINRQEKAWGAVVAIQKKVHSAAMLPNYSEAWEQGAGNCGEMSGIAAQIINKSGGYARKYDVDKKGTHVFTLVGIPPQGANDNINFTDYKGCWVVDPWAGIVCKAENYTQYFGKQMDKWAANNKMIRDKNVWINANNSNWLNAVTNGYKTPTHPEHYYSNSRDIYEEKEKLKEELEKLNQY